jgi:Leucine-rich repeat (LRR) protein
MRSTFYQNMARLLIQHRLLRQPLFRCVIPALVFAIASANPVLGNDMPAESFTQYAQSKDLSQDQTFTVELLIEEARREFDPDYFDLWEERSDAREEKGYIPAFLDDHIEPAWGELQKLEWLSLQRVRRLQRPLRNVEAVRYLTKLTGLVLIDNEVADISAVGALVNLKRLHLAYNPIKSLAPLATCLRIEELDIRGIPADDLSVLESLPKLRELEISIDQIPALEKLESLPTLKYLDIGIGDVESFDSFEGFPEMPEIQEIRGADVRSLKGLERFPKLKKLTNLSGEFDSLEPLRHAKKLSAANILDSHVGSLEPIVGLPSLSDLWIATEKADLELGDPDKLRSIKELTIRAAGKDIELPPDKKQVEQGVDPNA